MRETTDDRLADGTVVFSGAAAEAIAWVDRHIAATDAWTRRGEFLQRQIEANTEATNESRHALVRFADMTGKKLKEWKNDVEARRSRATSSTSRT